MQFFIRQKQRFAQAKRCFCPVGVLPSLAANWWFETGNCGSFFCVLQFFIRHKRLFAQAKRGFCPVFVPASLPADGGSETGNCGSCRSAGVLAGGWLCLKRAIAGLCFCILAIFYTTQTAFCTGKTLFLSCRGAAILGSELVV